MFNKDEILQMVQALESELFVKFELVKISDSFAEKTYDQTTSATPVLIFKRID